jgi:hypothetical protein
MRLIAYFSIVSSIFSCVISIARIGARPSLRARLISLEVIMADALKGACPTVSKAVSLPLWLISSDGVAVIGSSHLAVPGKRKHAPVMAQVELALLILALGYVDGGVADIKNSGAASRKLPETVNKGMCNETVGAGMVRRRRR